MVRADLSAARAGTLGLEPVVAPIFTIAPLDWAAPDPDRYDALLLTSANAVLCRTLLVTGDLAQLELRDGDGNLYELEGKSRVFLCRCGGSKTGFDHGFSFRCKAGEWQGDLALEGNLHGSRALVIEESEIVRSFVDRILPQTADYSLDYELYEVYSRGRRSAYSSGI